MMNWKYDDHELGEALATPADDARLFAGCPGPDRIWATIECRLSVEQRHAVVDHMATCPACAAAWQVAREMGARPPRWKVLWNFVPAWIRDTLVPQAIQRALVTAAEWISRPMIPSPRGVLTMSITRAHASAVIVLLVATGLTVQMMSPIVESPPPVYRGIVAAIAEEEVLRRDACRLSWSVTADAEGTLYELQVTDEHLEPIVSVLLDVGEYLLSEKDLEVVSQGGIIYWRVEAMFPDGGRSTSPTFITRIH